MDQKVTVIENDMKVHEEIKKFMVDIDLVSKNGSVAGQGLDIMLWLVAPEYAHKPWNYYQLFISFLNQREVEITLFAYIDHRFGYLSRAAAVLIQNMPLNEFLNNNPNINNKLACLVREMVELPYLKVVYAVFAAVGIRIIEPFYIKTIASRSIYYSDLYKDLGKMVDSTFFSLEGPVLESETEELFTGVMASFGKSVVAAVREAAEEHLEDCVTLTNLCFPKMRTVLARQRRDYGLSEEFPEEYPVFDQCSNIDDTPVNNMAMERAFGKADYRLQKLRDLNAVGR